MDLSAPERRALGALVEKALATPQHYPMSEASLLAACNQATNRHPVTDYDVNVLRPALIDLRARGLVRDVHRQGERVGRFRHLADEVWELDEGALALLAVLLLRGPQTVGELRTRSSRLHAFASIAEAEEALGRMAEGREPLVAVLPRQPGQSQERWRELTGADLPGEELVPDGEDAGAETATVPGVPLAAQVVQLREEVAQLSARLGALEAALGEEGLDEAAAGAQDPAQRTTT